MWDMRRGVGQGVLIVGLMIQSSPVAWAQLEAVDPALHAAVEALVTVDPEISADPELAQLCRQVAEATVVDPRERAAVTNEVITMQREGVDVASVIPTEVREAAREQFTKVQGEMQKELETLRANDPEKAKEIEFMMREGERQMQAFESGERYTPSTEMMEHARDMFGDWKEGMLAQGAPPEMVARAEFEFTQWTSGSEMAFGGPGHDMMGGAGGPPSVEQMQAMGMSAEQIQMATVQQQYIEMGSSGQMPTTEQMQAMGMSAEQIQMAQQYEAGSDFGINPSTGGWEPNMGGAVYGGGTTDWSAGGGAHVGYTDWSAGGGTYVVEGSNYGVNPATGGWEPGMGGGTTYTSDTLTSGHEYSTTTTTDTQTNKTELVQDTQTNKTDLTQERTEFVDHPHPGEGIHVHEIHIHTDGIRHDHTQEGSGL